MVQRATSTPGIPDIRDDNIAEVLRAIKSTLEVRERRSGDELDGFVRFRDLEDLNLADSGNSGGDDSGLPVGPVGPGGGPGGGIYNPGTDFTTPPAPTGFKVYPVFTVINMSWDGAPYPNHGYTEIWRAQIDDLSQALMVGTAVPNVYSDSSVDYDTEYWYWIRFVSKANVTGPWNSTSGTYGRTGRDIGKAIEALSTEIVNSALWTELSQRIGKIETDEYIKNRAINSKLEHLEERDLLATSRIFELSSVSSSQATQIRVLQSQGPSANRTFFTPERPDAESHGIVAGVPLIGGDVWYDTDESNRSYRWTGTQWEEFSLASGNKVYHQPDDPAIWDGTEWVDSAGRKIIDGDLWYDEDDGNHPYRWKGEELVWKDFSSGDASAEVITLEQTKIGYATLNTTTTRYGLAGSVFDNNGLIWNNVPSGDPAYTNSVQFWNSTHVDAPGTDSRVTWHVGLPFAKASKQVGVSMDGGASYNATVEQTFVAMKQTDTGLLAQYSVKTDVNGYIAGFGLSSTSPGYGQPTDSKFIVRADTFSLAPPQPPNPWVASTPYAKGALVWMAGGPSSIVHSFQSRVDGNVGHQPIWGAVNTPAKPNEDPFWNDLVVRLPFIATTTAQTIDGKTYPPGVWINSANIFDAQIVSAMIENLSASKIATGTLIASIGITTGQISGGVNPGAAVGDPSFGSGFYLGYSGGQYKFYSGDSLSNYVMWDGAKMQVRGHLMADSGWIAGINLLGGIMFNNGVSWLGGSGFYLDVNGYFRIGGPDKTPRMEWRQDSQSLTIYGAGGTVLFSTGTGINWSGVNVPPPGTSNSEIDITPHGTLIGGKPGGGQVSPYWIGAALPSGSNAPALLNTNIVLTKPTAGTITLTGAGGGTIAGVIMPGYRIGELGVNFTGTYIANAAIDTAQIANLAVGGAQIKTAAIQTAHIADLQVATLKIQGDAVMVPRMASNPNDVNHRRDQSDPSAPELGVNVWSLFKGVLPFNTEVVSKITVIFGCEVQQDTGSNGGRFWINCYLTRTGYGPLFSRHQMGIINNQPRYAQTCIFAFDNVPISGQSTPYFLHMTVEQLPINGTGSLSGGQTATNKFGNYKAVILCAKR